MFKINENKTMIDFCHNFSNCIGLVMQRKWFRSFRENVKHTQHIFPELNPNQKLNLSLYIPQGHFGNSALGNFDLIYSFTLYSS